MPLFFRIFLVIFAFGVIANELTLLVFANYISYVNENLGSDIFADRSFVSSLKNAFVFAFSVTLHYYVVCWGLSFCNHLQKIRR